MVGVGVIVGVLVAVGVRLGVRVGVMVGVSVAVGVGVSVGVAEGVGVLVKVGVGVAKKLNCPLHAGSRVRVKRRATSSLVRIPNMVSAFGEILHSQLVTRGRSNGYPVTWRLIPRLLVYRCLLH